MLEASTCLCAQNASFGKLVVLISFCGNPPYLVVQVERSVQGMELAVAVHGDGGAEPASSCQCLLQSSLERAPGLCLGQRRRQGLASGTYPSCCGWMALAVQFTYWPPPSLPTHRRQAQVLQQQPEFLRGTLFGFNLHVENRNRFALPVFVCVQSGASMGMRSFGFVSLGSRRCCGGAPAHSLRKAWAKSFQKFEGIFWRDQRKLLIGGLFSQESSRLGGPRCVGAPHGLANASVIKWQCESGREAEKGSASLECRCGEPEAWLTCCEPSVAGPQDRRTLKHAGCQSVAHMSLHQDHLWIPCIGILSDLLCEVCFSKARAPRLCRLLPSALPKLAASLSQNPLRSTYLHACTGCRQGAQWVPSNCTWHSSKASGSQPRIGQSCKYRAGLVAPSAETWQSGGSTGPKWLTSHKAYTPRHPTTDRSTTDVMILIKSNGYPT